MPFLGLQLEYVGVFVVLLFLLLQSNKKKMRRMQGSRIHSLMLQCQTDLRGNYCYGTKTVLVTLCQGISQPRQVI